MKRNAAVLRSRAPHFWCLFSNVQRLIIRFWATCLSCRQPGTVSAPPHTGNFLGRLAILKPFCSTIGLSGSPLVVYRSRWRTLSGTFTVHPIKYSAIGITADAFNVFIDARRNADRLVIRLVVECASFGDGRGLWYPASAAANVYAWRDLDTWNTAPVCD